jgi:hypothetical protein
MSDLLWAALFVAWAFFWLGVLWARNRTIWRPDPDLIAELVSLRMERAAVSEAGEALFSLAFAGAGREHSDHGAEPFSSLATCSDVICRSRAEVLLWAVAEGIATMRPDDEWLVAR